MPIQGIVMVMAIDAPHPLYSSFKTQTKKLRYMDITNDRLNNQQGSNGPLIKP